MDFANHDGAVADGNSSYCLNVDGIKLGDVAGNETNLSVQSVHCYGADHASYSTQNLLKEGDCCVDGLSCYNDGKMSGSGSSKVLTDPYLSDTSFRIDDHIKLMPTPQSDKGVLKTDKIVPILQSECAASSVGDRPQLFHDDDKIEAPGFDVETSGRALGRALSGFVSDVDVLAGKGGGHCEHLDMGGDEDQIHSQCIQESGDFNLGKEETNELAATLGKEMIIEMPAVTSGNLIRKGKYAKRLTVKAVQGNPMAVTISSIPQSPGFKKKGETNRKVGKTNTRRKKNEEPKRKSERNKDDGNKVSKGVKESRSRRDAKKGETDQSTMSHPSLEPQEKDNGLHKSRRSLRLKGGKKTSYYVNNSEFCEEEDELENPTPTSASNLLHCSSPSHSNSPPPTPPPQTDAVKDPRLVPSTKGYKCYLCDFTSKSRFVVKQHREVCHGEERFCCAQCSFSCKTKRELVKHEQIHLPQTVYRCTECNYTAKKLRYLERHMKTHQEKNGEEEQRGEGNKNCVEDFLFSCHLCEFRCHTKDELDSHLPTHSKNFRKYVCPYCGLPFRHKASYTRHLAVHPEACPYTCKVCGSGFKKKAHLHKHEETHKSVAPTEKNDNEETSTSNADGDNVGEEGCEGETVEAKKSKAPKVSGQSRKKKLKVKKITKTVPEGEGEGSEIFHCEQCSYSTTQKSLLRSHKRKHSDAKTHKCQHCGACFKRRYHLTRHKLSHNSDAPKFPCPHCPYATFRKHRLKVHIQTHQTNKPIKCSLCPYSCRHEWTLKYHMRKHTGNTAPGKSGQPAKIDFTCHLCGYQCKNTKNMKYHMMRHENKTPHTCPHCDYKCSSKSSIKDHLLQHAGLKPYLCSDCGKSFRNASRLSRHKLVHTEVKPYSCDHCDFSSRSKYNLRQHILRHTDKDKVKRRIRTKTVPSASAKPEVNPNVGSQMLKLNFQSDIQSLLGQSSYLDNIHPEPFSGQLNAGFIPMPSSGPSNQTSSVIADVEGLDKTLSGGVDTRSDTMSNKGLFNKEAQIQTMRNQNAPSVFSNFEPSHERFTASPNSNNGTVGNIGFDMNPTGGGFNPLVCHNEAPMGYNTYPHLPAPPPPNANFGGMDRGGGYSYMNPYFYNETVFPGYMSSNMNFYLGQTGMDTGHLNAGLDLRRHYDIGQSSLHVMSGHLDVDKEANALRMPEEQNDAVAVSDVNMSATRTFLESPSVFMGGGEKVFQKELGAEDNNMAVNVKTADEVVQSDVMASVTNTDVTTASVATSLSFLDTAVTCNEDEYSSLKAEAGEATLGCGEEEEHNGGVDFPPMLSDGPEEDGEEEEEEQNIESDEIPQDNEDVQQESSSSSQLKDDEKADTEENKAETSEKTKDSSSNIHYSPFFCTECGQMCETRSILQRHRRIHVAEKPHTCEICGKAFKRKDHMRAHMHTHSTEKPFKCSQCSYACNRKYRLRRHELSHTEERAHRCKVCAKSFDTEEELTEHAALHTAGFMYECDVDNCEFRCQAKSELNAHAKVHQVFLCEKCSYSCTSAPEFAAHKRMHHQEKTELICNICGYVCDSNKRLKYHMARHENKTPHSCPHCDYKCSSRSSLTDHLLNHEGIKPFLCAICGMRFRNTSRLNRHKLVHSDVKPHSCEYCSFSSRSKYNLKQHMLRHFKNDLAAPAASSSSSSAISAPARKTNRSQPLAAAAPTTTSTSSSAKLDVISQPDAFRLDLPPVTHPALRADLSHFSAAPPRTDFLGHPSFRTNLHMPPALSSLLPHPSQTAMGHPV